MDGTYEEQFMAFVDFLGFMEVSTQTDETTRVRVLELLQALAALRGEFNVESTQGESGTTTYIKPAISTFSDHIVVSYPLNSIHTGTGFDEPFTALVVTNSFHKLLARIAAAALRIGFLIRGGATIGKLYHGSGVVFGEALVEAYLVESRTSIYPRVVLSQQLLSRRVWVENQIGLAKDKDGLYHYDYFKHLLFNVAPPGNDWAANVKAWFDEVGLLIQNRLSDLRSRGKLNELAKWSWFANQFRESLVRLPPQLLTNIGISPNAIPQ